MPGRPDFDILIGEHLASGRCLAGHLKRWGAK
jgi:hypothetical protein